MRGKNGPFGPETPFINKVVIENVEENKEDEENFNEEGEKL